MGRNAQPVFYRRLEPPSLNGGTLQIPAESPHIQTRFGLGGDRT